MYTRKIKVHIQREQLNLVCHQVVNLSFAQNSPFENNNMVFFAEVQTIALEILHKERGF